MKISFNINGIPQAVEVDDENWINELTKWQVKGAQEINLKYKIVKSESSSIYYLKKLKN